MSEITKNKIAFAVGLLAVLFTLTPLLDDYGSVGFIFLGLQLKVNHLYLFLSATLGLGVYCYGFQFVFTKQRLPTAAGDIFYIIGLLTPIAYAMLFLISLLMQVISSLLNSDPLFQFLQFISGIAVGLLGAVVGYRARKLLASRLIQAERQQQYTQETILLSRAETLIESGHHDLSVIDAFRALEVAVRGSSIFSRNRLRISRHAGHWFHRMAAIDFTGCRPGISRMPPPLSEGLKR